MKVVSIRRYPVKSMMGEEINSCDITENGVYGDRSYGIIDQETDRIANAKNPKKWPNMFGHHARFVQPFTFPKQIPPVQITLPNGDVVKSDDDLVNERLSDSFSRRVTLQAPVINDEALDGDDSNADEVQNRASAVVEELADETLFDSAMIHLITTNTIDTLRKLTPESRIEARRFRPNIIIDVPGLEGFVEETWVGKILHIGNRVRLKITQPTERCVMTSLAQGDLPNDMNVLKTLVKENSGNFGVYAEVIQTGKIYTGDEIAII